MDDSKLPWFLSEKGIDALINREYYVVLDFETTNKSNGLAIDPDNHLVLACWTVVRGGVEEEKYKFGDEYDMGELLEDVKKAQFVVAHNAKFELQWLDRCGLDLHTVLVYDTMVMEWVIHGNIKVPYNLNDTAKRYGFRTKESIVSMLIKSKVCPSVIPESWLLKYCKIDVEICHDIFKAQKEALDRLDLWHIALARNVVIPVLADIEKQGLELDKEAVYAEERHLQQVVEETGKQLDLITGGINLGSTKQLAILLYETLGFAEPLDRDGKILKTDGGARATSKDAIAVLKPTTELQVKFLELYKEYNNASVLLSKNISFFKKVCDHLGGRFFGSLNHCRTANHRLASSGIELLIPGEKKASKAQIQNLPRQYKKLFTAHDPDYVITEYDGSQIEFRVGGELGHDDQIEYDIVNGVDIHSFTRDTMNAAYEKFKINKVLNRQDAKPETFAPMYGSTGKDPAQKEYVKAFRGKYHKLAKTQTDWTLTVADQKKLETAYGLIFYWPHATIQRSGYVKYTTEIYNLPISGFATGEIIPIALVHFWHRVAGMPVIIFNTVHDSICVRQPRRIVDEVTQIAKQAMTLDVYKFLKEVYRYEFHVPLGFGAKTGKNWGQAEEELKWDVWPDGNERHQVERNKVTTVVYDTRLGE